MKYVLIFMIFFINDLPSAADLDVTALIERAEKQILGTTFQCDAAMQIIRPDGNRNLKMRLWSEGREKAVVKILEPAKDRGISNLRMDLSLWQFLPNIDRLVKIPPSMMLQSWMGSDFTNDDIVKGSSIARDYTHKLERIEKINGDEIAHINCIPKPDAPVVWGRVVESIRIKDSVMVKRQFFSEKGELIRVLEGTNIKTFDKHTIPTTISITNLKKDGQKTVLSYDKVKYDQEIPANTFSQEFLRRPIKP